MDIRPIVTSGVTRRFGQVIAVDGVDLQVPAHSVYGFLGPNGAGKTTMIRLLLGLLPPDAGDVHLFEEPLQRRCPALLRRVGALVESPSLYPNLTGRENLEVTRRLIDATPAQVERALHVVHLAGVAHRRVSTYSSGMRQRLGLALALLTDPELVILDEPTNGLDPAGMQEIRALLGELAEEYGVTVFLSSHLLSEVELLATHIGIIQDGRLRFQGTLDALHAQVQEQVVLDVDHPERARHFLTHAGWHVSGNGGHRLAVVANGRSDAALLNAQLVGEGVNVYRLALERPTLEDVFLKLTNQALPG